MRILLVSFLCAMSTCIQALELTKEELQKIVARPSSADISAELRMYPASDCRFRLKINKADGTSDFLEYSARQRYVDGRYLVVTPEPADHMPLHMVRAYDPELRLYFGWDLFADGTIVNQSGMYDAERKVMSWIGDSVVQGKRISLRSIQSFADRALVVWKCQVYMDDVFQLAILGESQSVSSNSKP